MTRCCDLRDPPGFETSTVLFAEAPSRCRKLRSLQGLWYEVGLPAYLEAPKQAVAAWYPWCWLSRSCLGHACV